MNKHDRLKRIALRLDEWRIASGYSLLEVERATDLLISTQRALVRVEGYQGQIFSHRSEGTSQ